MGDFTRILHCLLADPISRRLIALCVLQLRNMHQQISVWDDNKE